MSTTAVYLGVLYSIIGRIFCFIFKQRLIQ